jgi:hypothetical protein
MEARRKVWHIFVALKKSSILTKTLQLRPSDTNKKFAILEKV